MTKKKTAERLPRFHGPRALMTVTETMRYGLDPDYQRNAEFLDAPRLNPAVIGVQVFDKFDRTIIEGSDEILARIVHALTRAHAHYVVAFMRALRTCESEGGERVLKFRHVRSGLHQVNGGRWKDKRTVDGVTIPWRGSQDTLESAAVWLWIVIADAVIGDEIVAGRRITYRDQWAEPWEADEA